MASCCTWLRGGDVCFDGEVWFERPGRLLGLLRGWFEGRSCVVVSSSVEGGGGRVVARCGGCVVVVCAEYCGGVEGLGALGRLAGELGLGRVWVRVAGVGDCGGVCRGVWIALLRGGG